MQGPGEGSRANWIGGLDMDARSLIPFVAATLFSLSAHALDCSGGANGGMDATGNECNGATAGTVALSGGAKFPSARAPKVATNKARSYSEPAVKPAAATRHTSTHSSVKHG
jgi:hypothetical protein